MKEKFINGMESMGMDRFKVQDFISDKGICENNQNLVLDHLDDPAYVNKLRERFQPGVVNSGMAPVG